MISRTCFILLVLFVLGGVHAHALVVSTGTTLSDAISERHNTSVNVYVDTDYAFDGSLVFAATNLDLNSTTLSFASADFTPLAAGYRLTKKITVNGNEPGSYTLRIDVRNATPQVIHTHTQTGTVHSAAPTILSTHPSGTQLGSSVVLRVTTDRNADCSYQKNGDNATTSPFAVTGSVTHEHVFSSLSENTYIYTVTCTNNGRTSDAVEIAFVVDYPPSAEIELDTDPPLRNGLVGVTVLTSEPLLEKPTLAYSYDSSPASFHSIALTGSGTKWEGYMIVDEDNSELVGSFHFQGRDLKGNTGSEITDGDLFLVDTQSPPKPESTRATALATGPIRIEWILDSDDVAEFKLYRSTSSGVSPVDFYRDMNGTGYKDYVVSDKVTYYYRVAAVDHAGNTGPLSDEVHATSTSKPASAQTTDSSDEPELPQVLPPEYVPLVDAVIRKVESARLDIEEAKITLDNEDENTKTLRGALGHASLYAQADRRLASWKDELNSLKDTYATQSSIEKTTREYEEKVKQLIKTLPRSVALTDSGEFLITVDENALKRAMDAVSRHLNTPLEDEKKLLKHNIIAQQAVKVVADITSYETTFLDGTVIDETLVTKTISHESPDDLEDVLLIENIPSTIVSEASDLRILTSNYEVVDPSTIIKWGLAKIGYNGEQVKYIIPRKVSTEEIKKTETSVIISQYQLENLEESKVVGYSIFSQVAHAIGIGTTGLQFVKGSFLLILVLGLYYVVMTSYPSLKNKVTQRFGNTDAALRQEANRLINQGYINVVRKNTRLARQNYNEIRILYTRLPKKIKLEVLEDCQELQRQLKQLERE